MKPLLLQFKEAPKSANLDYSIIEYDDELNLSIDRITRKPAVDCLQVNTETFTKANGEVSDCDNSIQLLVGSETLTLNRGELVDVGSNMERLRALMDTTTVTEAREDLDQDR